MTAPGNGSALGALGDRLASLASTGHPLGLPRARATALVEALSSGHPAGAALRASGLPAPVSRFVEVARPDDLPALLDGLIGLLGRARARATAVRSLAAYPAVLAAATAAVCAIAVFGTRPVVRAIVRAGRDATDAVALPGGILLAVALAGLGGLVLLALALAGLLPGLPPTASRLRHERAVALGAAALAARAGCALPASLRAAAALSPVAALQAAAEIAAGTLERGEPGGGETLFGQLGAGLFAATAAAGAGPATLEALAEMEEAAATAQLPADLVKIELFCLVLAGLAIASAGAALLAPYFALSLL